MLRFLGWGEGATFIQRVMSILDSRVRDTIHNEVKSLVKVTYTHAIL